MRHCYSTRSSCCSAAAAAAHHSAIIPLRVEFLLWILAGCSVVMLCVCLASGRNCYVPFRGVWSSTNHSFGMCM